MRRKHTFLIVVFLGAVVVAGLLAITSTVVLAQPSQASTGSDPAIGYRLERLDRFEASLRRQAAELRAKTPPSTTTVYRRAPAVPVGSTEYEDEDHEHEDHESDDEREDEAFDD